MPMMGANARPKTPIKARLQTVSARKEQSILINCVVDKAP